MRKALQTILVHVPSPFVVKNFLTTDAFRELVKKPDIHVVLLAPYFKVDYYRQKFSEFKNVSIESVPEEVLLNKIDLIYQFCIQNSLPTTTMLVKQYKSLYYGQWKLPVRIFLFLCARIFWYLGKLSWWKKILGLCYELVAPRSFKKLFDTYDFSLVYLPNLLHSADLRLILEARRRGVKTLGSIISWDNLTAKLLLPYPPDYFAVANYAMRDDLSVYDGVSPDRVTVVGYPQYDRYFRQEGLVSREEFAKKSGIDPNKPFILYAMAGPKNMSSDMAILSTLKDAFDTGRLPDMQVLIRPYPKYAGRDYKEKMLAADPRFIFDEKVTSLLKEINHWEFSDEDITYLANSIHHAAVVVSVLSTILIEAAVFDKPIVNIAFSGLNDEHKGKKEFYGSPVRFLDYEHVARLVGAGLLVSAHSATELVAILEGSVENPDLHKDALQKLKMLQSAYVDGRSGERLAKVFDTILNK